MPDSYTSAPSLALPGFRINSFRILLFCIAVAFVVGFYLLTSLRANLFEAQSSLLLILAVVLGIVSLWPAVAAMRLGGRWDIFQPLFYASWFFFLPQFVFASFLIVLTRFDSTAALLLPEPWTPRMAAIGLAILGSAGLSLGYFLPLGLRLGRTLPQFRVLDLPPDKLKPAALVFLGLGTLSGWGAFFSGSSGYQFNFEIPIFGATFVAFSQLTGLGMGIIWYSFFRNRRGWRLPALLAFSLEAMYIVTGGTRGAVLGAVISILAGYQYAQDSPRLGKLVRWIPLVVVALFVGMILGTVYRFMKIELMGRTARLGTGDLLTVSQQTYHFLGLILHREQGLSELGQAAWNSLAERVDGVSSLAVILSKASQLKAMEVALGMDNNILRDLATAFIPRFLWTAKPIVGVHEKIGNLYFNTLYSSPTTTYMGDLFRNFGIWGVLPGMLILGVFLRTIYVWLLEKRAPTPLRVSLYLILALTVNYEALYSTLFPTLIRALAVALVAFFLVKMVRMFTVRV
jgi:hypothetical protein